jgi:hypothetical protein
LYDCSYLHLHIYLDECISLDCPSNCHWVFDPKGEILGYFGRAFKESSFPKGILRIFILNFTSAHVLLLMLNHEIDTQLQSRGNLRIPRQELRRMLLDRLDKGITKLEWDKRLLSYSEDPSSGVVTVNFSDGETISCVSSFPCIKTLPSLMCVNQVGIVFFDIKDLLIGADGIRSVVRENRDTFENSSMSDLGLNYTGVSVIIGN